MKPTIRLALLFFAAFFFVGALPVRGADYPEPKEGSWVARDFRFSTGDVLPEVRLHYRTIGAPTGEPVLLLHGTTGSGANFLNKDMGDELFGPGQPLDASRYHVILPDALGTGKCRTTSATRRSSASWSASSSA